MGLVVVVGGGGAYLLFGPKEPAPAEKLQRALELVDQRESAWKLRQALTIVDDLEERKYVDPEFPAGLSFVRGMVAFLDGREVNGREQQQRYLTAIDEFDYASLRGMPAERKAEMTYALGVALQTVGLTTRAREMLEDALELWPQGRTEISLLLVENYRSSQNRELLDSATELLDELNQATDLSPADRNRALLLRSDVLNQVGRRAEAQAILGAVPFQRSGGGEHGMQLLRADGMVRDAEKLFSENNARDARIRLTAAQELLQVLTGSTIAPVTAAKANFLLGRSSELLDNNQAAITHYQNTIRRFESFDEAFSARVRLARVFQAEGRKEEAIREFRVVHSLVPRPQDFRNSEYTLSELQAEILDAALQWSETGDYAEAIVLSREMPPIIGREQGLTNAARYASNWAEAAVNAQQNAPADARPAMEPNIHERWSMSGTAWADLAEVMRTDSRYPEYLQTSAEHYRLAHQFENALAQLNRFIRAEPPQGLARAYVLRGQTLMDLDRLNDAVGDLQFVIDNAPTDPVSFEAMYLMGVSMLEMDRPDDALRAWNALLQSDDLRPSADEWRRAQFAYGRLLVLQAANEFRQSIPADGDEQTEEQVQLRESAFARWKEAVRSLSEYLGRYPDSPERIECHYMLASTYHKLSLELRERLNKPMPTNARNEVYRLMKLRLTEAANEYRRLQRDLQSLRANSQLDAYGQELYRTTFLEIPHVWFDQEEFQQAIDGYRTVATRFPDHVCVLRAYLQMARCYNRLDQPEEARRQLEQARVILRRLPDEAFDAPASGLSRDDWVAWLDWARQVQANRG